jgi:hypothetical protein
MTCSEEESVEHLILDCEEYQEQRDKIYAFFRGRPDPISLHSILGGLNDLEDNLKIVRIVIQFFKEIGKDLTL